MQKSRWGSSFSVATALHINWSLDLHVLYCSSGAQVWEPPLIHAHGFWLGWGDASIGKGVGEELV